MMMLPNNATSIRTAVEALKNPEGVDVGSVREAVEAVYVNESDRHDAIPLDDQGDDEAEELRSVIWCLESALTSMDDGELEEAIDMLESSLQSQFAP